MATYFISDLHLSPKKPHLIELFLQFLATEATKADALYILGDLFEMWIGDDNQEPDYCSIAEALAQLNQVGVPVYFMHGNRDFLVGNRFLEKSQCTLLPDPSVIQVYNDSILLTHGDLLCTLDIKYQRFRKWVRHPWIKKSFLLLPLSWRKYITSLIRRKSSSRNQNAFVPRYWDVALNTVYQFLRRYQTSIMIHGHTHQAKIHHFYLDTKPAKRIVLGEWGESGCAFIYSATAANFKTIL